MKNPKTVTLTTVEEPAVSEKNLPVSVNGCITLIKEIGVGNSNKLTNEEKATLLSILKPHQNEKKPQYWGIRGGQLDDTLEGVQFTLIIPIITRNRKGKIVKENEIPALFTVKNIKEGITQFGSGENVKKATFSALSISAWVPLDTVTAIDITF